MDETARANLFVHKKSLQMLGMPAEIILHAPGPLSLALSNIVGGGGESHASAAVLLQASHPFTLDRTIA